MQIVRDTISNAELHKMADKMFGHLVKAVVDIEQEIMVVDAGLHADEEMLLLDNGSQQRNLWGINLLPNLFGTAGFVVFDSMINMRPSWGNKTRGVDDPNIQKKIRELVDKLVVP